MRNLLIRIGSRPSPVLRDGLLPADEFAAQHGYGISTIDHDGRAEALEQMTRELNPELSKLDRGLLEEELSVLQGQIQYDGRIAGATKNWSACMHDRGFADLADIGDGRVAVMNRWDETTGNSEGQEPVDVAPSEMRESEVEIAVADHECRTQHYQETFEKVVYEHERLRR